MSDDAGEILRAHITIDVDKKPAEKAVDDTVKKFQGSVAPIESAGAKIKNVLKDINAEAGRGSGFGMLARSLMGTGALFAVGLFARELDEASQKALELSNELRRGEVNTQEALNKAMQSIPIFGALYDMAMNFEQAIDGSGAAQERLNEKFEEGLKAIKDEGTAFLALQELKRTSSIRLTQSLRQAQEDAGIADMPMGVGRTVAQAKSSRDSRISATVAQSSEIERSIREKYAQINGDVDARTDLSAGDKDVAHAQNDINMKKDIAAIQHQTGSMVDAYKAQYEAEAKEIESGEQELRQMRQANNEILANSIDAKVEAFKTAKAAEGYTGEALNNFADAEKSRLTNEALKGARDRLLELNKELRDNSALTYDEKMKANLATLTQLADEGKIAADSIGDLQQAFSDVLNADATNKMRQLQFAIEDIGKTEVQKQADEFQRMSGSIRDAYQYAYLLREQLTQSEVKAYGIRAAEAGLNDQERAAYEAQHVTGADSAQVFVAAAHASAAELTHSLRTPFEQFQDQVRNINQLVQYGGLSQKTAFLARAQATQGLMDSVKSQDIHSFVMDNLKNQFSAFAIGPQKYTEDNTTAIKGLTMSIGQLMMAGVKVNGGKVTGVYAK